MQYIMVLYDVNSDAILEEPLRNKISDKVVAVYQQLVNRLKEDRIKPNLHIFHNELLTEYKDTIAKNGMTF